MDGEVDEKDVATNYLNLAYEKAQEATQALVTWSTDVGCANSTSAVTDPRTWLTNRPCIQMMEQADLILYAAVADQKECTWPAIFHQTMAGTTHYHNKDCLKVRLQNSGGAW